MSTEDSPIFELRVGSSETTERPVDGLPYTRPFEVLIDAQAWADVLEHARRDLVHEQGGILLGECYEYKDQSAVRVTGAVPVASDESTEFSVRFSASAWAEIERELQERGAKKVGWYHTHPGITAFFSETDRLSHSTFFNLPWHIGVVIDPVTHDVAIYRWNNGKLEETLSVHLEIQNGVPPQLPLGIAMGREMRRASTARPGDASDEMGVVERVLSDVAARLSPRAGTTAIEDLLTVLISGAQLDPDDVRHLSDWLQHRQLAGEPLRRDHLRVVSNNPNPDGAIAIAAGYLAQIVADRVHVHGVGPGIGRCQFLRLPIHPSELALDERGRLFLLRRSGSSSSLYAMNQPLMHLRSESPPSLRTVAVAGDSWGRFGPIGKFLVTRNNLYAYAWEGFQHFQLVEGEKGPAVESVIDFANQSGVPDARSATAWTTDYAGNLFVLEASTHSLHHYDRARRTWRVLLEDAALRSATSICVGLVLHVLFDGPRKRVGQYRPDTGAAIAERYLDDEAQLLDISHIFSDGYRELYLVTASHIFAAD
jgi:proteasome lid subunit RPN8/RPN11